ncbi:hypothetical protein KIPB_015482, partial [Kipferlia bialata]|eukprot:g15482.t1
MAFTAYCEDLELDLPSKLRCIVNVGPQRVLFLCDRL